jgi:hypothetical protein
VRSDLFIIALALAACSTTGAVQEGPSVFKMGGALFALGSPQGDWRLLKGERGVTYQSNLDPGTVITIDATCGTEVDDAPLDVLTNHLLFGLTERDFKFREIIPFDAREAQRSRLTAKLDGVLFELETIVLKKNGCVMDLMYAAPPQRFEAHHGDFRGVVDGFRLIDARSS